VTPRKFSSSAAFSQTAAAYAATMAPALAPVAAEVVRRAALGPNETVLDIGTGTGTAARLALGEGRRVIGLDAAAGMLEIARRDVPGVEFLEADFTRIPLADGSVQAVLAVHALLFADDRVAALREWLRVTVPGGRLSLSVPGPGDVVPSAVFGEVYDRYGIEWAADDYPQPSAVVQWATDAGWTGVTGDAEPTSAIPLTDETAFRVWLRVGRMVTDWSADRVAAFGDDLMAVSPRGPDGSFRIPFGSIHLTARNAR
jgi:SAM-dependent methyltransferase